MRSVDISSAFTYGELEEEIYMRQPEGYHIGSPNMVFRLRKSLYGLKQAARQWNKKLRSVLEGIGYSRLRSDSSIYIYSKGDIKVIVPIFIDDITLVSKSDAAMTSAPLQPFVTLSSTEAEFVAAVEAGKEIKWTRNILTEFGFPPTLPSTLFVDNKSGISVAKNPEHHGRMKHLDLRFYWLREAVEEGLIDPLYVSTHEQVADILTKAVAKKVVEFAVPLLGLE
ncbi:hypothetical protein Agabi119p4_10542 [Agaricus bisporus var. burnettii]|uniref:Reverse transcriptase Ty1/copia-type domain-containing protein n=1 Tax=Agaricus bisporus var. burnettii TaxID=192524 RepID=A0A8H7C332_AGABI|nr:hypothetical protein Agabi119p4_10542 [Agaricus bisporus var. burnettii]